MVQHWTRSIQKLVLRPHQIGHENGREEKEMGNIGWMNASSISHSEPYPIQAMLTPIPCFLLSLDPPQFT